VIRDENVKCRHQQEQMQKIGRGQEALKDHRSIIEEPVLVFGGLGKIERINRKIEKVKGRKRPTFPVLTILQRAGHSLDPSGRSEVFEESINFAQLVAYVLGGFAVLGIKPKAREPLGHPEIHRVHDVHRKPPR
jgi:hypothetical protein